MRRLPLLIIALCAMHTTMADPALLQQKAVQSFVSDLVTHHGFSKKAVVDSLNQAKIQPAILNAMDHPYEKKNWTEYKKLFLTQTRIEAGLAFWKANRAALARAEKEYGVPAQMIVAILGVETIYGKKQGEYRVLDALSTLAFYYPKRSTFFTKELKEYFLLCRERKVAPTHYMGSYAGAIGMPQFMPSSYRFYAVDFSGKGKTDLVSNDSDVIGSVANYFHKHGWKMYDGVAQPAALRASSKGLKTNTRFANYSLQALAKAGVRGVTAALNPPNKAGLLALDTGVGTEYWLAYPNFYVITRYNTSPQYALVVHQFAETLKTLMNETVLVRPRAYV